MLKRITAIKVRQNLGQVMNEVALKEDEYIVERAGKPMVAIIPIEEYQRMKKEKDEFFQMFEEVQKAVRPGSEKPSILRLRRQLSLPVKVRPGDDQDCP